MQSLANMMASGCPAGARASVWQGSSDMAGGAGGQPSRGIHPDGKRSLTGS